VSSRKSTAEKETAAGERKRRGEHGEGERKLFTTFLCKQVAGVLELLLQLLCNTAHSEMSNAKDEAGPN